LIARITETARTDLSSLKDTLSDGASKLKKLASDWFSDVTDRYG
jgi:hypothetical protein